MCRKNICDLVYDFWRERLSPLQVPFDEVVLHMITTRTGLPSSKWVQGTGGRGTMRKASTDAWWRIIGSPATATLGDVWEVLFDSYDLSVHRKKGYSEGAKPLAWEDIMQEVHAQRGETPAEVTGRMLETAEITCEAGAGEGDWEDGDVTWLSGHEAAEVAEPVSDDFGNGTPSPMGSPIHAPVTPGA